MQREIKYIGHYDTDENTAQNRGYSLAASTKMNYICEVLNKLGYSVLIVSPSRTVNKKFYRGKIVKINERTSLKLFPTFPWGNKLQKFASVAFGDIMLFYYLISKVNRAETIVVYHSLGLRNVVNLAKRIKKFNVILEVEEIYHDVVSKASKRMLKTESKTFSSAEKYIFSTEFLNSKVNLNDKSYSIIYGAYRCEKDRRVSFNDNKIHVVYAGTLEPTKGALAASSSALFLPEGYHVHIIGFGSFEQIKLIQDNIEEVSKNSIATVTYDGLLRGEEYIQFLQKCDVGLCTQMSDATYNKTSFPSKILSYMGNGLRVLCSRIDTIEKSVLGQAVYYYEQQNPESIAKAIMQINLNESLDGRELILQLNDKFVYDMSELLRP